MSIEFHGGSEDKPLSELTIGDFCKLIEYAIDRTHHNQMALTYAAQRAACTLEALLAKPARRHRRRVAKAK